MSWKQARIFAQRLGREGEEPPRGRGLATAAGCPRGTSSSRGREGSSPRRSTRRPCGSAGKPVPILEGVRHSIWTGCAGMETGAAMLDVSGIPGPRLGPRAPSSRNAESALVWVDTSGKETPVDIPKGPILGARVSPDGERILVLLRLSGEAGRGPRRRTRGSPQRDLRDESDVGPSGDPGRTGSRSRPITKGRRRIYSRRIDAGPDEVETLWKGSDSCDLALGSWSRDGKTLAFVRADREADTTSGSWRGGRSRARSSRPGSTRATPTSPRTAAGSSTRRTDTGPGRESSSGPSRARAPRGRSPSGAAARPSGRGTVPRSSTGSGPRPEGTGPCSASA